MPLGCELKSRDDRLGTHAMNVQSPNFVSESTMIGSQEKEQVSSATASARLDGGTGFPLSEDPDSTHRNRYPLPNNINKSLRNPDSITRPKVKRHKPLSYSCKENIPPSSSLPNQLSEAFRRTVNNCCYPLLQTQTGSPPQPQHGQVCEVGRWNQRVELDSGCDSPPLPQSLYRYPDVPISFSHSIESKLLSSSIRCGPGSHQEESGVADDDDDGDLGFESCTQFDELMRLCLDKDEYIPQHQDAGPALVCPLCGIDISQWDEHSRQMHANDCLDESVPQLDILGMDADMQLSSRSAGISCVKKLEHVPNNDPVVEWLRGLDLGKYEEAFIQQEIDWDSLQWLTEEDIVTLGVTALGPRKKIMQSLKELREQYNISTEQENDGSSHKMVTTKKLSMNRLITEFFSGPSSDGNKKLESSRQQRLEDAQHNSFQRRTPMKKMLNGKKKDVPSWCCIPGTPFRVDAFQYLQRGCSHWFLTHFHIDHYQGLTRSFPYGKVYCSIITAKLINAKIGIPWNRIHVMPLNQKIEVAGVNVTCFDANHCPGSIIILFEPPNGKAVLHTGDFRFNEEMACIPALRACHIHTLILDTTYCNPQYNFPKQEVVLQFVVEAIQAESFNPKTLFLIGSYTIGKERLFLEVARVLHKKIHVTAAKLRLLECLDLPPEDMQWFTLNEFESNIHVVPMWTIQSFKRLKQLSSRYSERYSLIVAFTPTGWTFGKGKKSAGRRWQQGTIIRYEVPYSEHCSFEELKEFVKFISPINIIPSVTNGGEASSSAMTTLLLS